MLKAVKLYVKYVDWICLKLGRIAMYSIFLMIGVLMLDAVTRNIIHYPLSWCVEMAQFLITGYYFVGGPYSMQLGEHVRMDLIYEHLSVKNRARVDVVTSFFLLFYLGILLRGALSSTAYAIKYNEHKFSMWNPSMVPIKVLMVCAIILMLLQTISILFKDIAKAKGKNFNEL